MLDMLDMVDIGVDMRYSNEARGRGRRGEMGNDQSKRSFKLISLTRRKRGAVAALLQDRQIE
jgi:hypothetical protein